MRHEVVCISIGQAGVQISNASWELFCIEHGIEANGRRKDISNDDSEAFKTFFNESSTGQYVPRTITIDLEPTVIDEIRTGSYRNLFNPDQLINGFDDGCNNYARAHSTIGKLIIHPSLEAIRKEAEICDGLQGFFLLHSHGGGTGSGFTSLLLKSLTSEYARTSQLQLSVFPSPVLSTSVVEPYNCVLASTADIEQSDLTTLVNNEAVYNICNNLLSIIRPSFSSINRIISHVFSDLTVSLRFESSLKSDFSQMSTNLIPYPRIHFPLICYAPLMSENVAKHETVSTNQITRSIFRASNQLVTCDTKAGLFMSCVMQYRGNVTPKDVNAAIIQVKHNLKIRFVDWCPTGFKVGINSQISTTVPGSEMAQTNKSLTMVANTTAIKDPMENILIKFKSLHKRRAFIFWFVGEGMEEGEFVEAKEELQNLIADFIELSTDEEEKDEAAVENKSMIKKHTSNDSDQHNEPQVIIDETAHFDETKPTTEIEETSKSELEESNKESDIHSIENDEDFEILS